MESKKKVNYWDDGSIRSERWYVDGYLCREDGPACIHYYSDGTVEEESWWLDRKLHRTDGPAYVSYHDDGRVYTEDWAINGRDLNDSEIAEIKWRIAFDKGMMEVING